VIASGGEGNSAVEASRRTVLLVTRNFPPLLGGMERFNQRVLEQLSRSFRTAICGPRGCEAYLAPDVPVSTASIKPLAAFMTAMCVKTMRMVRRIRPDVIIAGSGLTAPVALLAGRVFGVPVIVFLYGLDLVVSNRWYQMFWLPAIRACDGFLAISQYTKSLALSKGISEERLRIVHPGVDIPPVDAQAASRFRSEFGLGERPIILSVGRLTRRKGLIEFIENSMPDIVRAFPDAVLVVVGGEPADALAGNRGGVTEDARLAAARLGLQDNLLLLGSLSDAAVQAAYRASQVHVFPVRDLPGDIEGFGIVALEAAINGVPTVAFAVGGVPDAVDPKRSGRLIAPDDYTAMSTAVKDYLGSTGSAQNRTACIEFAKEFAWDRIGIILEKSVGELIGTEFRVSPRSGSRPISDGK
jgi:phosphatidylinositol alpha-1,6-mannosyltransferase